MDAGSCHDVSSKARSTTSVAFKNLNVHAFGNHAGYQCTVSNFLVVCAEKFGNWALRKPKLRINILHNLNGILSGGEMLLVLGRPGSGCTTMLKSLAGQMYDLCIDDENSLNYQVWLSFKDISTELQGKVTYQAETDVHFPTLTMRQTLEFAGKAKRDPNQWSDCAADVEEEARTLGLTKALDTKMGDELLPGVSGGERKRTSIAELLLGDSIFQCWENSTRGLDSANALDFIKTLRKRTTESGSIAVVSLYQASEDIFNLFDKVTVLHEGRQIYFGSTCEAREYFSRLGFVPPHRSTTPDFLTSMSRPYHLQPETRHDAPWVPRCAKQFEQMWQGSQEYKRLLADIDIYASDYPIGGAESLKAIREQLHGSEKKLFPYVLSISKQVALCIPRGFLRIKNQIDVPIGTIVGNCVISIILGSMFYDMPTDTNSFFGRGVLLFFTSLVNTTLAGFESVQLWDDRPVIEKHARYGFYRAVTEAISSFTCQLPIKLLLTFVFNFPLYFLSNLNRTPGAFFTYYLFSFMSLLNGSVIYRSMGALSRTLAGSQPPGAMFVMLLTIYSGFVVPAKDMRPLLKWFSYINPVYYAFESMVINEFPGREFDCASYLPVDRVDSTPFICSSTGALQGQTLVSGNAYIRAEFGFLDSHLWRNFGILIGLFVLYAFIFLLSTEYITMPPPRSDVPLYPRKYTPSLPRPVDEEKVLDVQFGAESFKVASPNEEIDLSSTINAASLVFRSVNYEIKVGKGKKQETKRILDDVHGWVKPGTFTALMGASGAGKTTLLNVLAGRATTGVVTGDILVESQHQNTALARKIGYAQQDDIHLPTASVREALTFSALLRQPSHFTKAEKLSYVDYVMEILDMVAFQHSIIGRLNVEQRKRVTIGTELAARPELLLFLDEPTSGLDSDSSYAIISLLRRLADSGQAVLCTIHQPSSPLMAHFDHLIFLKEGQELYFGELGKSFRSVINYFESHGARKCKTAENPMEWIMDITGQNDATNWTAIWRDSEESRTVKKACEEMKESFDAKLTTKESQKDCATHFSTSFWYQACLVTKRAFEHDWRSPTYLYSKALTTFGCAFINGVSFWSSGSTSQDVQNQIFSLFLLLTIFGTHVQLIMSRFHASRTLFESRESQSRTYSWLAFLISNIVVELASQTVISVIAYVAWYYPLGMWKKAAEQGDLNGRSALVFLAIWSLMILFQTMSQMLMAVMPDVPGGINTATLLFMLSLIFAGVLVRPNALPRFWIFMYRATPLSYYVSAIMSTGLSGSQITCSVDDIVRLDAPAGETCGSFLGSSTTTVLNPNDSTGCEVCSYTTADALLAQFNIFFEDRWWNWGVTIVYNIVNIGLAIGLYWLTRVPRTLRKSN